MNPFSFEQLQQLSVGTRQQISDEYSIDAKGIYHNGKEITLGAITVAGKLLSSTDEIWYILQYDFEDNTKENIVSGSDLVPTKLSKLVSIGVPVNSKYVKDLSNALFLMGMKLKSRKVAEKIGLNEDDNNNLYYIGVETKNLLSKEIQETFDLRTSGSLEDYIEAIKILIAPYPELLCVFLLSIGIIVVGYLKQVTSKDLQGSIISLAGDSSSGKTTTAIVAVSVFGKSKQEKGSFIFSFGSTLNGVVSKIKYLNAVTVAIDDSSVLNEKKNLTSLIYTLTNSQEKERATKAGSSNSGNDYIVNTVTTGEDSIRNKASQKGGALLRVIEFVDVMYTKDAKHAEDLKAFFSSNYGVLAPDFAQLLLQMDCEAIVRVFDSSYEMLKSQYKKEMDSKLERYAKQLTVALVSSELMTSFYDVKIDKNALLNILVRNLNETAKLLNYSEHSYQLFKEWVQSHKSQFSRDKRNISSIGFLDVRSDSSVVWMTTSELEKVRKELGLPAIRTFTKELKKAKLLECEDDTHSTKKGPNGIRYYVIKINL